MQCNHIAHDNAKPAGTVQLLGPALKSPADELCQNCMDIWARIAVDSPRLHLEMTWYDHPAARPDRKMVYRHA